ncbi:lysine-specific demethylase JMJ28-like isoform X4 [Malus sylvestris]|uniref:lysine-specific demethylase JMJ28-like isoform X4 n=1 Tax=Malus sylvestris TaxID=3752 RepID=UPI0021AD4591|nr:lysine-specific demethylase JMJ28-like isoform X4 [Malus sylvestris]
MILYEVWVEYSNALNEYPISSSLSHDDCCVYPHPEKVRIQHSQTWPAFSVVEYQQVHLKFLIKFGIEPWSFEQHLGKVVFIPAGCPFQAREKELIKQKALEKARKLQVKKNRMFQRKKYTRAHLEIAGGYRHMVYMK